MANLEASVVLLSTLLSVAAHASPPPTPSAAAPAKPPSTVGEGKLISAVVLTGHNNHNWAFTSRLHAETLRATGRFSVEVCDDPAEMLADAAKAGQYQLFVLDYNDAHQPKRWGDKAEANFVKAVRGGAGVVSIHAANNAFDGWAEYEQMLGLLWRKGAGHGKYHTFDVNISSEPHPITQGLTTFAAQNDELYHGLSNPRRTGVVTLATALSDKANGGIGTTEPMLMTTSFGQGRIVSTTLGHVWEGDQATKQSVLSPAFRSMLARSAEWAATGAVTLPVTWSDTRKHNTLTPEQTKAGWTLLFDGKATPLRGYKKTGWPAEGWAIEGSTPAEGVIRHIAGKGGGDLATPEQYENFEFSVDWNAAAGANSGIIYLSTEDRNYPWETGLEMQILDNQGHKDGGNSKTSAGALYDLVATSADVVRPAGQWNTAIVRVTAGKLGKRIEHFLNGVRVVDVELGSPEYVAAHAKSKWPAMKEFATRSKGHITLQDHGDDVRFRNIMVKKIEGK